MQMQEQELGLDAAFVWRRLGGDEPGEWRGSGGCAFLLSGLCSAGGGLGCFKGSRAGGSGVAQLGRPPWAAGARPCMQVQRNSSG